MQEFLVTGLFGCLLIAMCSMLIYELLRHLWGGILPNMQWPPRQRVLLVVAAVFIGHIVNIWIFGLVYYGILLYDGGTFASGAGDHVGYQMDVFGCLYFSAVTYSTVGFGDITPQGGLRMIAGVEALTGFILIGWTVSFTYLVMGKFWELPHRRKKD